MANKIIQQPYKIFTDAKGDALENGYIYIGEVNQNPETNPITVYWDAEATLPAPQPLRTVSGYISRNGSPASVYVTTDYSITIRDKNELLVTTAPIPTETTNVVAAFTDMEKLIGFNDATEDTSVNIQGYYDPGDGGGGVFNWDSAINKTTANAGTIIDPDKTLALQGTGTGTGCWVRQYSGAVNVKWFGAKSDAVDIDTGTDDATAFQAASDVGNGVFIPAGGYKLSTCTIDNPIIVEGKGMGKTVIYPVDTYSTMIVATDNVTIRDLEFRGKTGTDQTAQSGDCIKFDAVTNNPAFARHMEGCKIERVKFRNLTKNGIYVPHLLRESHIRECRFVGMGNDTGNRSAIKMKNQLGSASNINNIWIDKNQFYRFDNPPINLERSALISPLYNAASHVDIRITNNLIHGQLQDESAAIEIVQPAPTSHIKIEDGSLTTISGNNITSIHPQYYGIDAVCGGTACKALIATKNTFSVKGVVGGVTYSRALTNSTGAFVKCEGNETIAVHDNSCTGGTYVEDFILSNGDYPTTIDVNVSNNLSEAGSIVVNHSGLGTIDTGWRGVIEEYEKTITNKDLEMTGNVAIVSGALSTFARTGSALALKYKYDTATSGAFIGSPGANQMQISTNGGSPLLVIQSTSATRPGADDSYSLGTASYRWTVVYATTGTINTSDETTKTTIETISATEKAAALEIKSSIGKFKFLDAIDKKGESARTHFGVGAQTVKTIMESHGLVAEQYAFFCYDEWEDQFIDDIELVGEEPVVVGKKLDVPAGSRYGIRYEELLAFILAAI